MAIMIYNARAVHLDQLLRFEGGTYMHPSHHRPAWVRGLDSALLETAEARTGHGLAGDHWLALLGDILRIIGTYEPILVEFEVPGEAYPLSLSHTPDGGWKLVNEVGYGDPVPRDAPCTVWLGEAGYKPVRRTRWKAGEPMHELAPLPLNQIIQRRRLATV